jgi:aromatic-L-amino-acid/L-tryptophan decarboxylase
VGPHIPQHRYLIDTIAGGSVIQGSAGEAAIVAFLAAITKKTTSVRQRLFQSDGTCFPTFCSRDNMVVFSSDQAHAIVKKACMVLGIGHHRVIPTSKENNFAMNSEDLRDAVSEELAMGRLPVAVVATTGTTSSCAFDPVQAIADVCKEFGVWLHIDAAYGGAYACVPELQPLFSGLQQVDSFVVNCHKKLLCPFDIAALYVADRGPVLQALSLQPEYLRNAASESGAVVDYEHWQLPLGRRFRALKLWFVFRRYGTDKIRLHLEKGLALSAYFSSLLMGEESEQLFELAVPVSLSLVCFRLKGRSEEDQKRFLYNIKATGDCFIIHTKLADRMVLRFACGGLEQSREDVYNAFKVILRVAKEM